MRFKLSPIIALIFVATTVQAQSPNYPGLKWFTHTTPHFVIHYHEGVEETAGKVAAVAEEAYDFVTKKYNHTPSRKTRIVVRDDHDTANGHAYWHLDWITIYATNSTVPLRGTHDWVYGTLVHEFSHIISLQKSASIFQLIEGIRVGGLEDEPKSTHVDSGISLYLSANTVPRWWAEGVAQVDTAAMGFDTWDTYQDMLLRMATLEDTLLDFDSLQNINVQRNFGPELVYNQSFRFLSYLSERFGDDVHLRIAANQAKEKYLVFDNNFKGVIGISLKEAYKDWLKKIRYNYTKATEKLRASLYEGTRIKLVSDSTIKAIDNREDRETADGVWNFSPRTSPDGRFFSYVSHNKVTLKFLEHPYDVLDAEPVDNVDLEFTAPPEAEPSDGALDDSPTTLTSIRTSRKSERLQFTITLEGAQYAWSNDSKSLFITRKGRNLLGEYDVYDLYLADLTPLCEIIDEYLSLSESERRKNAKYYRLKLADVDVETFALTVRGRTRFPNVSPDNLIAFSVNVDGRNVIKAFSLTPNLGLKELKFSIDHGPQSQSLFPQFSPDGSKLVYYLLSDFSKAGGLWLFDLRSGKSEALIADGEHVFTNPSWSRDGTRLYFSSDINDGIFQLYSIDLKTRHSSMETRVISGAFDAFELPTGELLYSRFSAFGFKPYILKRNSVSVGSILTTNNSNNTEGELEYKPLDGERYSLDLRPLRVFPIFIFEDRQAKGGVSINIADFHEKHNINALAVLGFDQDFGFSYVNRQLVFDVYASLDRFVRSSRSFVLFSDGDGIDDEPRTLNRFSVNFIEAGVKQRLYPRHFFNGDHTFSLAFTKRRVNREVGIPTVVSDDGDIGTSFDRVRNAGVKAKWNYSYFQNRYDPRNDVNPRKGRIIDADFAHIWTNLYPADPLLTPATDKYNFNRLRFDYREFLPVPYTQQHTLEIGFSGGYIDRDVTLDDQFFAGGRLNFRAFGDINANSSFSGYEDFSITGETLLLLQTTYRFPILYDLRKKKSVVFFDSLYGALFYEMGNAWNYGETKNCRQNVTGNDPTCSAGTVLLTDVGAELRLKAFLINDFNAWNSVLRVAYGFQDDAARGFSDNDLPVRIYFGLGTDF